QDLLRPFEYLMPARWIESDEQLVDQSVHLGIVVGALPVSVALGSEIALEEKLSGLGCDRADDLGIPFVRQRAHGRLHRRWNHAPTERPQLIQHRQGREVE